jgi:hypothetical protein
MQGLATFLMRGRVHAAAAVVAASVLPLLGWFGAAVLALVTLRRGLWDGLAVAAAAAAALAAVYGLLAGLPQLVLQPVLESWLPTLLLAAWLRRTVSLASSLRLAAVLAGACVLGLYLIYPDQQAFWAPLMERIGGHVPQANEAWSVFSERVLPLLTGLWVLSIEATVLLALLTGRWMQSLLYYPGGFRQEFHGLNLGRPAAGAAAGLLLAAMLSGPGLVYDVALVVGGVFTLQALALAHAVVAARGRSRGWLVALYVLLPLLFELAVVVGIADAAFDWRRRLLERSGRDGSA